MASRITIFDHYCRPLAETTVSTTPRSWVLDDVGRAEWTVSTSDPICKLVNLQYGNLVLIEHLPARDESGNVKGRLPDWVGMILPPRNWALGELPVVAFSAECVMAFRPMPFVKIQGTPGTMFKQILQFANDLPSGIKVQPGNIADLSKPLEDDLRISAHEHIKTLAQNAGMNWDVTAERADDGSLLLFANLYESKGLDTDQLLNPSNTELGDPLLSEQGVPFNYVIGYSHAFTDRDRKKLIGVNQSSFDDYGLLGMNEIFLGLHDGASVAAASQARADSAGRPQMILGRIALDQGDLFDYMECGNSLRVHDPNVGFSPNGGFGLNARVRVVSVDYNDLTDKCPLKLEVIDANE